MSNPNAAPIELCRIGGHQRNLHLHDLAKTLHSTTSEDHERIEDLLTVMSHIPMTLELLKDTNVGKIVNKLRNHPHIGIANTARKLVNGWKRVWKEARVGKEARKEARVRKEKQLLTEQNGQLPRALPNEPIPENFFYFGSGTKKGACELSNFYEVIVTIDGLTYPSAEHAYQAAKFDLPTRRRFAIGGDLASWSAMRFFVSEDKVDTKIAYWKKKGMIGILAKMASNPRHAKKAGLPPKKKVRQDIFLPILRCKYREGTVLCKLLLDTGTQYLVEFDRGAKRTETHPTKSRRSRWAGLVDGTDTSTLYGDNRMGLCLMAIRTELQNA